MAWGVVEMNAKFFITKYKEEFDMLSADIKYYVTRFDSLAEMLKCLSRAHKKDELLFDEYKQILKQFQILKGEYNKVSWKIQNIYKCLIFNDTAYDTLIFNEPVNKKLMERLGKLTFQNAKCRTQIKEINQKFKNIAQKITRYAEFDNKIK